MGDVVVEAVEVTRTFGRVRALDNVSLAVPRGAVLGLLGHNGAGKTTLVHILATLLPLTSGAASIAGYDVCTQGREVRRRIGLTGQYASVDQQLSGRENIRLIARLLGASKAEARQRTDELLEMFDLAHAADRTAKTYSGGMRRRLDLAASLVGRPDVIFLDEPTTGLDPTSRTALWEHVERLVRDGAAVLLTTQYLDEADRLADRITVLSQGKVVGAGTAAELKAQVGEKALRITLPADADLAVASDALRRSGFTPAADEKDYALSVPVTGSARLSTVVRALDEVAIDVVEATVTEPTLNDVYLNLAGETPAAASTAGATA
ncbi:ATP-binding cassette domain-containing protein [Amycolatopsis ultiminotia]|uniref:ATP-binding cassette domain-containing protein n=1 Tax=Amycolatopsis ultiminotia TaxID=543629 RepID=A0ABP6XW06_9PSEU